MERPAHAPTVDRIHRECDCPPWVLKCVHWEGRRVLLGDIELTCISHQIRASARYAVDAHEQRRWFHASCGCMTAETPIGLDSWHPTSITTDDLDAALAAFHEAEEALLRGDV
jgi:hypothetical protein